MSDPDNDAESGAARQPGGAPDIADEPTEASGYRPDMEAPTDPSTPMIPDLVAQARQEAADLKDKYLRTAADFDNFRKRARRDTEDAERRGKETLLRDLLPVFDNLERAVVHASQANEAKAVADGVRMVLRQFSDTLERVGIKRVQTTGSSFDPNLHEAIQQLETSDHAPGTVVAEVQAGYLMGERLIRAAMVVVAKAPAGASPPSDGSGQGSGEATS
jgi:molecular chaperone GrpE